MRCKIYALFTVLTAFATCTSAQTRFNNLEEVWLYADKHNVSITNSEIENKKAIAGRKQAYMDLMPDINANGTFTNNTSLQTTLLPAVIFGGPEGVYTPVQFGQKYIYNVGFTAQLDLVNLQSWHNIRIAKETEEINKVAVANTKKNIYQQIAAQYYAYLLNEEALKLAQRSAYVADSIYVSVNNKFEEGTASLPNKDIALLNSERAKQTAITAYFQLRTSRNQLKSLLGLSITDSMEITQRLTSSPKNDINNISLAEDPTIKLAYHQSVLNHNKYKASNAGIYPTLSMTYSNNTQQNDNEFRPLQSGGPQWFPASFWSLRASWNIFNGGNRWLQSQRNKLTYEQSVADYEQAKKQSAINDENLKLGYSKAKQLLNKAENIMNLSYDNYTHISLRHEEGLASLEDKLRAFSEYISYQNQYLNSLSELLVQLYTIKIRQQTF
jgi:outer membrane protein